METSSTGGSNGNHDRSTIPVFDLTSNCVQRIAAIRGPFQGPATISQQQYTAYGKTVGQFITTAYSPSSYSPSSYVDYNDLEFPFLYRGKYGYYTDTDSGLIYCQNRFYDPGNGRWLTRDPIGYEGGVNLYAYCSGNPVMGADPSGLLEIWDLAFIGLDVVFISDNIRRKDGWGLAIDLLCLGFDVFPGTPGVAGALVHSSGAVSKTVTATRTARAGAKAAQVGWYGGGLITTAGSGRMGTHTYSTPASSGSSGGTATRATYVTREQRWMQLANDPKSGMSKHMRDFILRHNGRGVAERFGQELAHRPKMANIQGHDYSQAVPRTIADHRGIEHRYLRERASGTTIGMPRSGSMGRGRLSLPPAGSLP